MTGGEAGWKHLCAACGAPSQRIPERCWVCGQPFMEAPRRSRRPALEPPPESPADTVVLLAVAVALFGVYASAPGLGVLLTLCALPLAILRLHLGGAAGCLAILLTVFGILVAGCVAFFFTCLALARGRGVDPLGLSVLAGLATSIGLAVLAVRVARSRRSRPPPDR